MEKLHKDYTFDKNYEYWKKYREKLAKIIKEEDNQLPKTTKNIYDMSKKIGIKATSRYYNISPSSVRYHISKYENEKNSIF